MSGSARQQQIPLDKFYIHCNTWKINVYKNVDSLIKCARRVSGTTLIKRTLSNIGKTMPSNLHLHIIIQNLIS